MNDCVLLSMPADTKFFVYQDVPLAYSPGTGMCWRVNSRNGNWNLVTPGTLKGAYTGLRIGANIFNLHRIVAEIFLNAGKPLTAQQEVDHKEQVDRSHWQDRLANLRICSRSENQQNQKLSGRNTSGYKGVSWKKSTGKWRAAIVISGKLQHLGYFQTPESAAEAYDAAAIHHFGEFACTNRSLGLLSYATLAPA